MRWPALVLLLAACAAPPPASPPDRNGLYRQMQACLAETTPGPPCTVVDPARGFVVIADDDPAKPDSWLIVPATAVTGIEDPRALRPPVLGFWRIGWHEGLRLLERPPADIALAINSRGGRTQDLLHIHISCVLPQVRDALAAAAIGADWAPAPFVTFAGHPYNARKVASLEPSPFLRLRELPATRADMAAQSLAVIGSADGGFYLLAEDSPDAEAEELLDQTCR